MMTLSDELIQEIMKRKRVLLIELIEMAEKKAGEDFRSKGGAVLAVACALRKLKEYEEFDIGFRF